MVRIAIKIYSISPYQRRLLLEGTFHSDKELMSIGRNQAYHITGLCGAAIKVVEWEKSEKSVGFGRWRGFESRGGFWTFFGVSLL